MISPFYLGLIAGILIGANLAVIAIGLRMMLGRRGDDETIILQD